MKHVNIAYFDQLSIPEWTLEEDNSDPPKTPNARRNPLSQITMTVPGEPATDPQRGPTSPRHRAWNANGAKPTHFEWVALNDSLQWRGFKQLVELLRSRGADVMVILGPFNEHFIADDQLSTYHALRDGVAAWLDANNVPHVVPQPLPTELYADASHALTQGYAALAHNLCTDPTFTAWLAKQPSRATAPNDIIGEQAWRPNPSRDFEDISRESPVGLLNTVGHHAVSAPKRNPRGPYDVHGIENHHARQFSRNEFRIGFVGRFALIAVGCFSVDCRGCSPRKLRNGLRFETEDSKWEDQ